MSSVTSMQRRVLTGAGGVLSRWQTPDPVGPGVLSADSRIVIPSGVAAGGPGITGNQVATAASQLIQGGYRYPPNVTTRYCHTPMKVGACADFVADSYLKAGFDLGQAISQAGGYAANAQSMMSYFQHHQVFTANGKGPAQLGDAIFFDWNNHPPTHADHAAVVTKVDAQGRPIEIMESYNFNLPAKVTEISPSDPDIIGYGHLSGMGPGTVSGSPTPVLSHGPADPGVLQVLGSLLSRVVYWIRSLFSAPAVSRPASTSAAPTSTASTYTVRAGDTLAAIAVRYLGSANRWTEIYQLNRAQIQDPNTIQPGQVLEMPAS